MWRNRYNEIWPTSGWGSIEYGPDGRRGQVVGGRWKPLHYELKRSTFADHLSTCNDAGACFVRNDAPFAFEGDVSVRLINMLTAKSTQLMSQSLSLVAGAGTTSWYCAAPTNAVGEVVGISATPANYTRHCVQIPLDRSNFTKTCNGMVPCEAMCDADKACVGFTFIGGPTCTNCAGFIYEQNDKRSMQQYGGADWYQKPGTPTIPGTKPNKCPPPPTPPPPPPPPCATIKSELNCTYPRCRWSDGSCANPPPPPPAKTPPAALSCHKWAKIPAWDIVGCDLNGTNCVAVITVTNQTSHTQSTNILPFVPPKDMQLSAATVTATVGDKSFVGSDGANRVNITLSTTATALYVVLTTTQPGRFSDNAILLETNAARTLQFIAWKPSLDVGALRSSLRVEHLHENLS